jgi:DNA polymerase type B, organellar and viral
VSFNVGHVVSDVQNSTQRMRKHRAANFEFIGVDGEGITLANGEHRYVLFGVGQNQLENPDGLDWREVFEFLYHEFTEHPSAAFVGFFLGYDFSQILKTLPENRARILLTREGINARQRKRSGGNRKPFPVRHMDWEFDMLPGRRLQLRPLVCDCDERHKKCPHSRPRWMYLCDSGPFWQTAFLNVIDPSKWQVPICTAEEYDHVLQGKARRATAQLDDEMRFYNRLENTLLARAMSALREGFVEIGVNLSRAQWFGPGQAAAAWFKKEGIPRREQLEEIVKPEFSEAARKSYFGGWFEIFSHGIIPGNSWEYDINSAYPHIIRNLPCLLHGRYANGVGIPPDAYWSANSLTLVRAKVTGRNPYIGSALHRNSKGTIARPKTTEGWYWLSELNSARKAKLIHGYEFYEWIAYRPCKCPPPLRGMADLYETRLRVGKDTILGKSCKLVYNSGYGKFAQSVGSAPYGNWVYASLITSGCRRMITDAIATHPEGAKSVLMVATDGVYFDAPHPKLKVSNRLGEWGSEIRENLTLFKPGVYWDDGSRLRISQGSAVGFKARGLDARTFARHIGEIDRMFLKHSGGPEAIPEFRVWLSENHTVGHETGWPTIEFKASFSMTTALMALMAGRWGDAGTIQDVTLRHTSEPWDKRTEPYWDGDKRRIRTQVLELEDFKSREYEKHHGLLDPFSNDRMEMLGTSMDELIAMQMNLWRRLLTREE